MHRSNHGVADHGRTSRHYNLLTLGRPRKPYCSVALPTKDLADGVLRSLHGAARPGQPTTVEPGTPALSRIKLNDQSAELHSDDEPHGHTALQGRKRTDEVDNSGYEAGRLVVQDLPPSSSNYDYGIEIQKLFREFKV